MSEESPRGDSLPDDVGTWLDGRAEECGLTRAEFLRGLADEMEAIDGRFADRDHVSALEDDLNEKIEDVRERVLQVKREADGKAPAGHDHVDVQRRVSATDERVTDLAEAVDDLQGRIEETEARVDEGFENFGEVLDYLTETTDDLGEKTQTLATALLDVRDGVRRLASGTSPVDQLAAEANRLGVREAACGDCGATVDVALLREPACPHCGATFSAVDPKSGWFGSHRLRTGQRPPALESPDEELLAEGDVVAIADDGGERRE